MTARLSADERDLLREWVHIIAPVIANPSEECRRLRESRRSGGGFGRNYEVTGQRFTGTWAHYEVNRPGFAGGSFTWFQRLPGPGSHGSW